jgi:hypothetical protein
LAALQRNWDTFGRLDPLWAILTDPRHKGNRWDLVHEGIAWFADLGSRRAEVATSVGSAGSARSQPKAEPPVAPPAHEPQMEMHAVRRERVEELLAGSGARMLDTRRVHHCGPTWLAFRYDCSR